MNGTPKRPNQSMFALMGLLSFGAMTGYELRRLIDESVQHFWRESYGQIYPSLKELESKGLVSRRAEKGKVAGRPDRQVYSLTDTGYAALCEWLATPARPEVPRNELLLKIFFGRGASAEVNLRHIAEHRGAQSDELAGYAATENRLKADYSGHPDLPYWLLTLSYGKQACLGAIRWCDEAAEILQEIAKKTKGE